MTEPKQDGELTGREVSRPKLIQCPLSCNNMHSTGCGPKCIRTRNEKIMRKYQAALAAMKETSK